MFCLFNDMFLGFPIWIWLVIITVVLYVAHKKKKLPRQINEAAAKVSQFVDNNTPEPIKEATKKVSNGVATVATGVANGVATGVASIIPDINNATSKVSKQAAAAFGYF